MKTFLRKLATYLFSIGASAAIGVAVVGFYLGSPVFERMLPVLTQAAPWLFLFWAYLSLAAALLGTGRTLRSHTWASLGALVLLAPFFGAVIIGCLWLWRTLPPTAGLIAVGVGTLFSGSLIYAILRNGSGPSGAYAETRYEDGFQANAGINPSTGYPLTHPGSGVDVGGFLLGETPSDHTQWLGDASGFAGGSGMNFSDDMNPLSPGINPASGLPMITEFGLDIAGNVYGTDSTFNSPSSFDDWTSTSSSSTFDDDWNRS